MSARTTGPFQLTAGTQVTLNPPDSSPWALVVISNRSQFELALQLGGDQRTVAPWQEALYRLPSSASPVAATPSIPIGASTLSGASSEVEATWFSPGETPAGTWPVPLVANAVAAATSIASSVTVTQSSGANLHADVDNTVATTPQPTSQAPYAGQITLTASAQQLPNSGTLTRGVWLRMTPGSGTHPFYVGPSGVTTTTGMVVDHVDPPVFFPVANANQLYVVGTAGDVLTILGM